MPQYQGIWTLQDAARLQSQQQWATDPLYRNTTLLLQADNAPNAAQNNTFLDSSANAFTITRNGNTTQGTFTPFSATGWGNFFNGTTDFLSLTQVSLTGDFTIEAWLWFNTGASNPIPVGQLSGPTNKQALAYSSGFQYYQSNGGGNITGTIPLGLNQWIHLAVSRVSGTVRIFTNGALDGSTADTSTFSYNRIGCIASGVNMLNGYISNLRVLDGTGLYTTSFTPSTIPLTAITNTNLLTCQSNRFVDNSASPLTLTVNGTPSVQAFAPFAPQFQYTPTVIGGSGYFDGTGDWLTLSGSQNFTPGTGDWTVEGWLYSISGNWALVSGSNFYINNNGGTVYLGDGATDIIAVSPPPTGTWTHIAGTRSGSTVRLFYNGTQVGSSSSALSTATTTSMVVGGRPAQSISTNGYLSSVRIVVGTAVYTSAFTPPTAPLTAITNTQFLCNFTNAAITDGTMKNNLETVGNAQVSTSVVKYGSGSMAFDGTGDYLTTPANAAFNFGTGDFTIEFWLYYNSVSGFQTLLDINYTTAPNVLLQPSSGTMVMYYNGGSTLVSSAADTTGVWRHYAIVRSGTAMTMYRNGVSVASVTFSGNVGNSSAIVNVGGSLGGGGYYTNGYIDDLRITKGIARYTANFTPPQVALPRQ